MPILSALAVAGALATVHLAVLIWWVQLWVYPNFRLVRPEDWSVFHVRHGRLLGILAGVPMIVELGGSAALFATAFLTSEHSGAWSLLRLAITAGTWMITFGWAVPMHRRLANGYDLAVIERLIRLNRWRAGLWTLNLLVLIVGWGRFPL